MDRTKTKAAAEDGSAVVAHAIAECATMPVRTNASKNQALNILKTKLFPTMDHTKAKAAAGDDSVVVAQAIAECPAIPVRTNAYKNQAMALLKITFPRLSVDAIRGTLEEKRFQFTPAFEILSRINIIDGADKGEERALILADAPFLKHVKRIVLKGPRPRRMPRLHIADPALVEEVDAIPEMNKKENRAPNTKVEEEKVKQEVAAREIEVTCECCFGDEPTKTIIQCDQGKHFFCFVCVRRYVQEQLFGQDTSIVQCISLEADGCKAGFSTVELTRALTDDVLKAYDIHQTSTEIVKANIKGLW
jgi:hypothetical protein